MVYVPMVLKHLESWAREAVAARKASHAGNVAGPKLEIVKSITFLLGCVVTHCLLMYHA